MSFPSSLTAHSAGASFAALSQVYEETVQKYINLMSNSNDNGYTSSHTSFISTICFSLLRQAMCTRYGSNTIGADLGEYVPRIIGECSSFAKKEKNEHGKTIKLIIEKEFDFNSNNATGRLKIVEKVMQQAKNRFTTISVWGDPSAVQAKEQLIATAQDVVDWAAAKAQEIAKKGASAATASAAASSATAVDSKMNK